MLKKSFKGMLILLAGILLAFMLVGCGDDGGSNSGGAGGLSGTYRSAESDENTTVTIRFSGSTFTAHLKAPAAGIDDDVMRGNYSVSGNTVTITVTWVNPTFDDPSYGGGYDETEDYFTIVNATTLRDSDGGYWFKQ
jgi:hypothetical protein